MRLCGIRSLTLMMAWLVAATALACKLPVFRYALERWPVDRYRIIALVHDRDLEAAEGALSSLQDFAPSGANADVEVINLSTLSEADQWQLEGVDEEIETPWMQVFYPSRDGRSKKCWEGPLSAATVNAWRDSPTRQQIVGDLVSGVSVVWVMIDGDQTQQNERVAEILRTSLAEAAKKIQIPDGVVARDGANEYLREHPEASIDDVLRCDVPLKVDFRLRRIARDDAREVSLREIAKGLGGPTDRALVVPIFGRGRMLDAIDADKIDDRMVLAACQYMVGECSCTVKAQNPGVDLLLTANWDAELEQTVVVVDDTESSEPVLIPIPSGVAASGEIATSGAGNAMGWGLLGCAAVVLLAGLLWRRPLAR